MNLSRRGFLGKIIAAAVAPAIIRTAGLIMPVKPMIITPESEFLRKAQELRRDMEMTMLETYESIGNCEDLADVIYNISPTHTPFLSIVSAPPFETFHEWQTMPLVAA